MFIYITDLQSHQPSSTYILLRPQVLTATKRVREGRRTRCAHKISFNMITDYSNYTNRTKTPTRRGLTLLVMLRLPASPLFTSISMPAGGEISPLSLFTSISMRNPSTSPVHHDFDTSRWGNPSATLFTSISMGEPLRHPCSPQFQCQQVEEPLHRLIHLNFDRGTPTSPNFNASRWRNPSTTAIHLR